ncbi:CHAT domain-containing protein [Candidatus Uhrbacteria bacterium]|nr:MAG: CHAT domain-containing protein [Candidatus Uhrbacteria bacterium]
MAEIHELLGAEEEVRRITRKLRSQFPRLISPAAMEMLKRQPSHSGWQQRVAFPALTSDEVGAFAAIGVAADDERTAKRAAHFSRLDYVPRMLLLDVLGRLIGGDGAQGLPPDEAYAFTRAFHAVALSIDEWKLAATHAMYRWILSVDRSSEAADEAVRVIERLLAHGASVPARVRGASLALCAEAGLRCDRPNEELSARAVEAARESRRPHLEMRALFVHAHTLWRLERSMDAALAFGGAVRVASELMLRVASEDRKAAIADWCRQAADCAIVASIDADRPDLALEVAESVRSRALLDALGSPGIGHSAVLEVRQEVGRLAQKLELAEFAARVGGGDRAHVEQVEEEYLALRRALAERDRPFAAYAGTASLSHAEVLKRIDPGEAIVSFTEVFDDELVVLVTTGDGTAAVILENRDKIYELISASQVVMERRGAPPARVVRHFGRAVLATLWDALLRPIQPLIRDSDHLVFVPTGPLLSAPFAALVPDREAPTRYLGDEYSIGVAPSVSALLMCRARALTKAAAPTSALVVSVDYDEAAEPLAGAKLEAESIAEILRLSVRTQHCRGKRVFTAEAGLHEILHVACHGEFVLGQPLLASLCFPRGERLTMMEVRELQLAATRLVVLSACETGRQAMGAGSEAYGLVRAFLEAGACEVVSAGWRIDDDATSEYMGHFYRAVAAGMSPATAVSRAALHLREQGFLHPKYWAAFCVHGAARYSNQARACASAPRTCASRWNEPRMCPTDPCRGSLSATRDPCARSSASHTVPVMGSIDSGPHWRFLVEFHAGRLALWSSDLDEAFRRLVECRRLAKDSGLRSDALRTEWLGCAAAVAQDDPDAKGIRDRLLSLAEHCEWTGFIELLIDVKLTLAEWCLQVGDRAYALESASDALAIGTRGDFRLKRAEAHEVSARIHFLRGDQERAASDAALACHLASCESSEHVRVLEGMKELVATLRR